jgi:hypothetical protein
LSYDLGSEVRREFYLKAQGEFISVLRLKRKTSCDDIAHFFRRSISDVHRIERGDLRLNDRDFFNVCAYLGGANDVSVFVEKMEKALSPGLREARRDMGKFLWIYGITFADEEKS